MERDGKNLKNFGNSNNGSRYQKLFYKNETTPKTFRVLPAIVASRCF